MQKPNNVSINDWFLLSQKYHDMYYVLRKLATGYPIQYMIGYVDFYDIKIKVNKNVLIPRYETEYLVSKTISYVANKFNEPLKIVDAGTGSGCIALKIKSILTKSKVIGYDISNKALKVARINRNINKLKVTFKNKSFNEMKEKNVDILISNPPYIGDNDQVDDNVKKYEPNLALFSRKNDLKFYKEILKKSLEIMNNKCLIAFEIGNNQGLRLIQLAKEYYPTAIIKIEQDLNKKDRFLFIMNNI